MSLYRKSPAYKTLIYYPNNTKVNPFRQKICYLPDFRPTHPKKPRGVKTPRAAVDGYDVFAVAGFKPAMIPRHMAALKATTASDRSSLRVFARGNQRVTSRIERHVHFSSIILLMALNEPAFIRTRYMPEGKLPALKATR